jgi:hypothetical protein
MLELGAAARGIGRLTAALACLAVLAGCGSVAGVAGTASAVRSPGAVARPAPDADAASQARTGSAGSPPAGPPAAGATVKHFDFLNGVSCASAANCTAVGDYYQTASGPQVTLIERWNGTAWRVEPSPSTGRGSTLDSVSCPGAASCTAVGSLVLGWNGVTWTVELRSSPFTSVSCTAPSSCMAVGVTAGGTPESGYFDGTNWTLEPMPRPAHPAQNITLAAVSCAGPGFCLAVGDYSYGVGAKPSPTARDRTLAERWNGSSWQVTGSVDVASWDQLSAVSCTSPRACTAVGSSASGQFPLAERWDGSTWTTQHVPDVNAIGYTQLTAVSCSSARACMALGTYNGASAPSPSRGTAPRGSCTRCPARHSPNRTSGRPACRAPGPPHAPRSGPTAARSPRWGPARTGGSRPPPVSNPGS